ncbi:EamA-like transporter family protein [Paenibacillus sp. HJL G12]|uniref:EamA-like transporter family protein n=1 Tax=Paenibacillus dendrobii TaxID=2691084 RepID=A0A7X3IFE4_9BACL|nr:DMT family transporter [Paenibacillus dendrobii]MWV42897.1 EamA-like transporter family protein [Paenibacillus dendrobii]
MILGIVLALLAGSLVSLQNIFNNKVNVHVGSWTTTTIVLGLGFAASFTLGLIFEGTEMFNLHHMKTWNMFSGLIGVGVVTCMVQGINRLGPTFAVSISMCAQLGFALLFDSMGWLGLEKVDFTLKQLIGVLVVVGGIVVFKLGGREKKRMTNEHGLAASSIE